MEHGSKHTLHPTKPGQGTRANRRGSLSGLGISSVRTPENRSVETAGREKPSKLMLQGDTGDKKKRAVMQNRRPARGGKG